MQTPHVKKLVSIGVVLVAAACLWFYFAPVGLGGSTSYVDTDGISMEPHFHAGDLVLVRSQSNYHVGEIVAYHSKVFHTIVLHRIVARAGARYVFKGDNNNFVDFEHPARSQLIGALWLHIPGAGSSLASIRSPALVGVLVGVGMLLLTGAAFAGRRRRRRRQRRAAETAQGPPMPSPQRFPEPLLAAFGAGVLVLLPFAALAVLAFTRPPSALLPLSIPYKQRGEFSYSADSEPGPAYQGDRAVTGDPLFTHVVSAVNLRFGYHFDTAPAHSLTGKATLAATVASTSGWQTTFELGRPTYFRGDHAVVSARLDLTSLLNLVHRVEAVTAVGGSYTLTITPHVSANGSVNLMPLRTTFSPRLQFSLSKLEIQPVAPAGSSPGGGQSSTSLFSQSASGAATGRRYQPLFLSFKVARLSVATARRIALGAIALLVCALVAILVFARPRWRDESAAIQAKYGRMLIQVARVWQQPGVAVIDVADIQALARIAEHYDRSILHETNEEGEAFWVTDESGQFRYAISSSAWAAEAPEYELDVEAVEPDLTGVATGEEQQWAADDDAATSEQESFRRRSTWEAPDLYLRPQIRGL